MSKDTDKKPAANKDPVAGNDAVAATEDTRLIISAAQLLANDSDRDGDKLKITSVGAGNNCSVSIDCNGNIVIDPKANFSGVASFSYTISDGHGGFSTATVSVNVGAVADAAALTVSDAVGTADTAIALNVNASLTDTDGSETLNLVIGGVPAGATLNHGKHNADGTWTLTTADLTGLTITPPTHNDADFNLTVKAISTESSNGSTATTQQTLHVVVNPAAPVLAVQDAAGNEDTAIALNISVSGPGTTLVTISGVPEGATLNHGVHNADGSWTLTKAQLVGLAITPAHDSDADFALKVSVRSASSGDHDSPHGNEGLGNGEDAPPPGHSTNQNDGPGTSPGNPGSRGGSEGRGGDGDHGDHGNDDHKGRGDHGDDDDYGTTTTQTIHVTVNAVADLPTLSVTDASGNAGSQIALNIAAALTDTDGSETLSIRVTGVPAGDSLSAGTHNADGSWTLTSAQLTGLQLITVAGTGGDFNLTVAATSVEARDSSQSTNTATIHLHLNGGALPIVAAADSGAALEDSSAVVSGNVLANDTDPNVGGVLQVVAPGTIAGHYGTLTLGADGNYSYVLNNALTSVQALAEGQQVTESFAYQAKDQLGAISNSANLVVTITGTNDVAVIGGASTGSVTEDVSVNGSGNLTTSGALTASDADAGQSSFAAQPNAAGQYGTFTLAANGAWTYAANDNQGAIQQLGQGQSLTDSFTAVSSDGSANQVVTVTINGTNDVAVIGGVSTGSVTEDVSVNGSGNLTTSGALTASDADAGQSSFTAQPSVAGHYGTFTLAANGAWTYTADDNQGAIQQLGQGQSLTDSFTAVSSDGGTSQVVTVTINGTNDVPTVSSAVVVAAMEDGVTQNIDLLAGAHDVDNGAVLHTSTIVGLPAGITQSGDSLMVDPTNAAFQHLAQGATQVLVFNYSVSDGLGGSVPQTATITITGTNDAPTVSGAVIGAATEDGPQQNIDLLAGAHDVDDGAVLHASAISGLPAGVIQAGDTLIVDPTNVAFQHLPQGATQLLTIDYNVVDGLGGSVAQTATITITGTNDAPTVSGAVIGSATEDGAVRTIDLLTGAQDADDGAVLHASTIAGLPAGVTQSGDSVVVDPTDAAFQHLAQGATQLLVFNYSVSDGLGGSVAQTATITITGTNDAPTVSSVVTGAATEDGPQQNIDLLAGAHDVDDGAVLHASAISGLPAGVIQAGDTLIVDPTNAAFQDLAKDETQLLTIHYNVVDQFGGTVAQTAQITVTGTNDAPVAQNASFTSTEDSPPQSFDLVTKLTASDIDHGDAVSVLSVSTISGALSYSLAGGTISFDPNQYNSLSAGEDGISNLLVTFQDTLGATATAVLHVDVRGINDLPVAQDATVKTNENALVQTVSLAPVMGAHDPDSHDALTVSSISLASVVLKDAAGNAVTNPAVPLALSNFAFTDHHDGTISFDTNQFNALPEYLQGQFWTNEAKLNVTFTDGSASVTRTLTVDVDGRNDAVVAQSGRYIATEDSPVVSHLDIVSSFKVVDPDFGDTVTIHSIGTRSGGLQFTVNSDDTISFDPNQYDSLSQGQQATTVLNVTFADSAGRLTTLQLSVEVDGINDAPVAHGDSFSIASGAALVVAGSGVLANDSDVENSALYAVLGQGPAHGSLTLNLDGSFTYVANAGYEGADGFTYRAFDNLAYSAETAVAIMVTGFNFAAQIGGVDTGSVQEDGQLTASGLLTISDLNPGQAVFNAATYDGTWGSLALDVAGHWTYTLDNGVAQALGNGELVDDAITITSIDGTEHAIVVAVAGVNDAPLAGDDAINLPGDVASTISIASLMANDHDIDGSDSIHYVLGSITVAYDVTPGDRGTVVEDGHGNLIYTPPGGFGGSAVFSYGIADQNGAVATGTVHLSVGVNHSPIVVDDHAATQNGDSVTVAVLANDTDPDPGETATLTVSGATGALHGDVVVNQDGTIDYTPSIDYAYNDALHNPHDDSFQYTVVDSHGAATIGTVIIFNNAAPAANDDPSYQTDEDTTVGIDPVSLLVNDTDPNGDPLVIVGVAENSFNGGTVTFDGTTIYYTPATNYNGTDSFQYTISDGHGGESTASVYVDVLPVNDPPSPATGVLGINEDQNGSGQLVATDPENDPVQFALSTATDAAPLHGTVEIAADGTYTYTPDANYSGSDRFWFTASDGNGGFADNYVDVQITAVADVPYLIVPSSGPVAGDELLLSSGAAGASDHTPAVGTFSNGDFIAVWVETSSDGKSASIVSQRFAADGSAALDGNNNPLPQQVVAAATTDAMNLDPRVLVMSDGSYVVSWTHHDISNGGNATDVFAQRYDDTGAAWGPSFQVNVDPGNALYEDRESLVATVDSQGVADNGFMVTWNTFDYAHQVGGDVAGTIQARTYDALGSAGNQVELANNAGHGSGLYIPAVASFGDGSYVLTWQATDAATGNYDIYARIIHADGTKGDAFVVSATSGINADYAPSVAVLDSGTPGVPGDAIIAWDKAGGQNGTDDIVAQRIGHNGALIGSMFTVSTDQGTGEIDFNPVVVARPGGGFVVTYETLQNANNAFDISAQLYGASGNRAGNEFTVSVDTANGYDDRNAAAALTSDGGFVVAWESVNPLVNPNHLTESTDITARVYGPGDGLSGHEDTPLALFPLFAALTDTDGSEVLSMTISGVPTGAHLSAGTDLHNGSWLFSTQAELDSLLGLTFTAPLNESGNYTLTATAESRETSNNDVAFNTQSFSFIIAPVNDPPVASASEFEVRSGALIDHVIASDVDDSVLVYGILTDAQHGQVSIDPNSGIFNYASAPGYYGDDSFTFAVSDNHGDAPATATVTLHVMPVPTLVGTAGDNILTGTAGNDVIVGGLGNDVLTGGGGTDVFVFSLGANDGQDTITDFDQATGVLEFKDVLASPASKVDAIDALIAGIHSDGAGGTKVDFSSGGSIDFTSIAFSGQLSIADLLHDTAAQLLVSHG